MLSLVFGNSLYGYRVNVIFLDYRKAFDSVSSIDVKIPLFSNRSRSTPLDPDSRILVSNFPSLKKFNNLLFPM